MGNNENAIWVISLKMMSAKDEDNFFIVIKHEEEDRPISCGNKICIFEKENIINFLEKIYKIKHSEKKLDRMIDLKMDMSNLIHIIEQKSFDQESNIVNSLNVYFDIIKFLGLRMPIRTKRVLYNIADFMTFTNNIDSYWKEGKYSKYDVINSVLWLYGAVVHNAVINPDLKTIDLLN